MLFRSSSFFTMSEPLKPEEQVLTEISDCLDQQSAEALLRIRASEAMQERIEWLAEQNTAGAITAEVREEYEALVRLGSFVSILQGRARQRFMSGQAA